MLNIATFGVLFIAVYIFSTSALPPCVCTIIMKPVCGSDGRTYENQCSFDCAKLSNPFISVTKEGKCETEENKCLCTFEYKPICGSDGKTYPNECSFNCVQKTKKDLTITARQSCEDLCMCPAIYKPVCGSDSKTYPNDCVLECDQKKKHGLTVASQGACPYAANVVKREIQKEEDCECERNLRPVCGTDGVTYGNPCELNCTAMVTKNQLLVKHIGACTKED